MSTAGTPAGTPFARTRPAGRRDSLYRVAREVTDEIFGEGAYAEVNKGNPDPRIQEEVRLSAMDAKEPEPQVTIETGQCRWCGLSIERQVTETGAVAWYHQLTLLVTCKPRFAAPLEDEA